MVDAAERIDRIEYQKVQEENETTTVFYNGPAEFLVDKMAKRLVEVSQFAKIFGDNIDGYKRMDYSIRALPAIRLYNDNYIKDYESWFINGDIKCDLILPANLRRQETQQIQDTLSAAVVQQFRRPAFFASLCEQVPGLNELGKRVTVDKSLGFEWDETEVPLTQITLNFRLDLRQWDNYLEQTNRTKDSPFVGVLADLEKIVTTIQGLRDDNETVETEIGVTQTIEGD